jgi:hypothetical protein
MLTESGSSAIGVFCLAHYFRILSNQLSAFFLGEFMGDCKHRGKPAGFLRSTDDECKRQFENGKLEILAAISQAVTERSALDSLPARITSIAQRSFVPYSEQRALIVRSWGNAVDKFLEDGILKESEEKRFQ